MDTILRRTKAAILTAQNAPLIIADIELPLLSVGQVLVKIAASGICGKQVEELSGKRGEDPYLPHLLGHEAAGTVIEVGPGVRKVKPADHVVLHWMKGPGIDAAAVCFPYNGTMLNGGPITTFSELSIVSENRLTVIPPHINLLDAALLGCAVTTGLGIVWNNLGLLPGQSLVVFGVGGVGLNVLQAARLVNAFPIVAVDVSDQKLEDARAFGATHTVAADDPNLKSTLLGIAGGSGFDAAAEVTGNPHVRELAYEVTSPTGTTVLAGVPHYADRLSIDALPLAFGKQLLASHGGETKPERDIPRAIHLYEQGRLKLKEQISHTFPLEKINEAFELMKSGKARRCMLVMDAELFSRQDEKTREPQYQGQIELRDRKGLTPLGYTTNIVWETDPRRLTFILARYKFVAKMLSGKSRVVEIGCGDAFGARIVLQEVKHLTVMDFDPLFIHDVKQRMQPPWVFDAVVHDMLSGPVPGGPFDAAYTLDVLEHIPAADEQRFLGNICASLTQNGVLLIGTPSLESQQYASAPSKAGHINCKSQEELRLLLSRFFENVFVFGMNDEVLHTGFGKMAHYLFAVAVGKR